MCGAARTLQAHAAALEQSGLYGHVRIGFLNYTSPRFSEAVDELVQDGSLEIIIVPYFLVAGKFVTEDLPEEIGAARERHPHVTFTVAEAVLAAPEMADAILESASLAHQLEERFTLRHVQPFDCELRSNCPLYDTRSCPRFEAPS